MSSTNRPLSPHLQVYKPQLTSVLSVLHRGTGIVITIAAIFITAWLWSAGSAEQCYIAVQQIASSTFGKICLILWTLCTSYHLLNGIRHLFWDWGYGFELDRAYLTGRLIVIGAGVLTLLIWIL